MVYHQSLVECAAAIAVLAFATAQQEHHCAVLIVLTSVGYGLFYAFLRFNGFLLPKDIKLSHADEAEWRSRILATIHAVILTVSSFLCFTEWPYEPAAEGWIAQNRIPSYPSTFASHFVGYLQWDLCWLIWHRKEHKDPSAAIHHSLFICVTHFVLIGTYFQKPFAWLSFTELSTPFLNVRWFYAASGKKDGLGYLYSSYGFAFTFLFTRVIGYTAGLVDVLVSYSKWNSIWGLYGVVAGLFVGYMLNLFWAVKVISALRRAVKKRSKISD